MQHVDFDRLIKLASGAIACAEGEDAIHLVEEEAMLARSLARQRADAEGALLKLRVLLLRLVADDGDSVDGQINILLLRSAMADLRMITQPDSFPRPVP